MTESSHTLRARWVFPVDGPPIPDGVVVIENGIVVEVSVGPHRRARDLGDVAIIPGLVNAHTHLEFSDVTKPLPPGEQFAEWIRSVVAHRRRRSQSPQSIIERGLRECAASGSVLVGEIATDDVSVACLNESPLGGVVFREILGLSEEAIEPQLDLGRLFLEADELGKVLTAMHGLSPHAPYSLHPALFEKVMDLAREHRAPVAMHLAETREELELLDRGTGPLVETLRSFGVWQDGLFSPGTTVMDYLRSLAKLDRVLIVHGNYLSEEGIEFLSQRPGLTVVYCPRTHAYFGHDVHPWRELLQRGASLALGTDSRASNPDLSLWEEVLFLRKRFPDVSPEALLRLATLEGARALDLHGLSGSLTKGKWADLVVVRLAPGSFGRNIGDPHERLLNRRSRIVATMRSGRWIHGGDQD